jgi:hypothetical protein
MAEIETTNDQLVSFNGANEAIFVMHPKPMETRQTAYRHAAWIVAMAEMLPVDPVQVDGAGIPYTLDDYIQAVENT